MPVHAVLLGSNVPVSPAPVDLTVVLIEFKAALYVKNSVMVSKKTNGPWPEIGGFNCECLSPFKSGCLVHGICRRPVRKMQQWDLWSVYQSNGRASNYSP